MRDSGLLQSNTARFMMAADLTIIVEPYFAWGCFSVFWFHDSQVFLGGQMGALSRLKFGIRELNAFAWKNLPVKSSR